MDIVGKLTIVGLFCACTTIFGVDRKESEESPATLPASAQRQLLQSLHASEPGVRLLVAKKYVDIVTGDSGMLVEFLEKRSEALRKKQAFGKNDDISLIAVQVLGDLHSPEGTLILINLLECRDDSFPIVSNEWMPHFPHFPSAVALAKIGAPAIAPLLKVVHDSDETSLRFQLSCLTLKSILGERAATAIVRTLEEDDKAFRNSPKEQAALRFVGCNINIWDAMECKDFRL